MLSDFVSLFFPNYCMACNNGLVKGEELLCLACDHEIPRTQSHHHKDNFVANKFYGKILLFDAVAYFRFSKSGKVQQLLHCLKYKNMPELGEYLGRRYGSELKTKGFEVAYDLIVPVPLHQRKLKRRGYNQSAMIARGLADALNLPVKQDLIIRNISTSTQTRKSRIERWRNVDAIFSIKAKVTINDKTILLVDDVITTGATLESCAQVLLDAGCKAVGVAAIAAAK